MKLIKTIIAASLFSTFSSAAVAEFHIHDAYARATPPSAPNSAAFMVLENHGDETRSVVSAESDVAKRVELHNHAMVDGMMKMRQIAKIDVGPNSQVVLKPGGLHVMLFDLNKPLKEGETISVSLKLRNGEVVTSDIPVKKVMSGMKKDHHHDH